MTPKHIKQVPESRKAIAPYNFVELPDVVVEAEEIPPLNQYHSNRHTGRIECVLTTDSPLYIRCGMTPDNFAEFSGKDDDLSEDQKKQKRQIMADFFQYPTSQHPALAGSSLRGMLRTLVEIVGYGKLTKVSEQQRFFFRAVAAKSDDPLASPYKNLLKNVKAGYLVQRGYQWYVRPAKTVINNLSFIWVKEKSLTRTNVPDLIKMDRVQDYEPQYIPVSFEGSFTRNNRRFAENVSQNIEAYRDKGMLVTSGNMLESTDKPSSLNRKNHCIVFAPDLKADIIPIDENAIEDYCNTLTDFQKKPPFDKEKGVLKDGRAIFYCERSGKDGKVTRFGHSPNFRIAYIPKKRDRAASVLDFIPQNLRDPNQRDLAEAIFGFVRDKKQEENQAQAGRVFVGDAICQQSTNDDIWWTGNLEKSMTPLILASPKPTTFQHYLVQTTADKKELKHYGSEPEKETVIRGHKLYWHKGSAPSIQLSDNPDSKDDSKSQTTDIKPIKSGVSFNFTIHFENLSPVELGALLWILKLAANPKYRLSLGMGKPLGMGAVKITHELWLSDRVNRYSKLFQNNNWATGDNLATVEESEKCVNAFESHILKSLRGKGETAQKLEEVPRIKMLLAMLSFPGLSADTTRYMKIERDVNKPYIGKPKKGEKTVNEYQERPVLPTPLDVMQWPDDRTIDKPPPSKTNRSTSNSQQPTKKPKPILRSQQDKKKSKQAHLEGGHDNNLATQRPPKKPKK
ncbi:TIGR03986 family type III CRISPR-associated RAMP protein [Oxynema aestuarii]|uniref:TIGR03986 family CRISPR-associated RAMP protein n=1 Tax=Oxynema aestuarii AP17 TaxID=2064643 RepID=A0A6H1U031_9CYAN|nr:TIGR03986 family CRISPR-associated RAMP protein [Oxynema aestuarii]QIZ72191.1 TIGR03986 family CRISPR-associated RAMP protein [Oxynema aestuarii AP17]